MRVSTFRPNSWQGWVGDAGFTLAADRRKVLAIRSSSTVAVSLSLKMITIS